MSSADHHATMVRRRIAAGIGILLIVIVLL